MVRIRVHNEDLELAQAAVVTVESFMKSQIINGVVDGEQLTMPTIQGGYLIFNPAELDTVWALILSLPETFFQPIKNLLTAQDRHIIEDLCRIWGIINE